MNWRDDVTRNNAETENALMEALQRVASGKPHEGRNIRLAAKGRLRVTFVAVTREANRSRMLLASDRSGYANVRRAILATQIRDSKIHRRPLQVCGKPHAARDIRDVPAGRCCDGKVDEFD